ncbi:hypothetical protein [Spelaeicoccus albus]|uniref:Sulfotransferase family protein n=1 Tax=Spelaeicoccus albus TaxID=1280376 RepID=A0A7Z0A8U0_9MICO|nr:hypothetical protein [Spelaeicoccus albus]
MKTGTTSTQSAASSLRGQLLGNGVRYPGTTLNHRKAIGAFMNKSVLLEQRNGAVGQRPDRSVDEAVPPSEEWERLMAEVETDHSRRAWISHEFAAESSNAMARKFVDALGERTHIVITLRNPAEILPSLWTQRLKSGQDDSFEAWLQRVFNMVPEQPMRKQFRRSQNQGALVSRWASIVGPENVTVIVVDKRRPELLLQSFERLLGLPEGLLSAAQTNGVTSNRSLTRAEAELLLQINRAAKDAAISWADYTKLIRHGAIGRLLDSRTPAGDEPRLQMPEWAAELARDRGRKYAKRIARSGVRVVGDLNALSAPVNTSVGTEAGLRSVPMDVAVESILGTLDAAIGKGVFRSAAPEGAKQRALAFASHLIRAADTHTSRDLSHALKVELRRRVKTSIAALRR